MTPRLEFALGAALTGGRATLPYFQTGVHVERKLDGSPVTVADREAEEVIRGLIEKAFPGQPIMGEEGGGDLEGDGWVVDPIDGTKSFVCGVPLFGTLLSYEQEGKPILGVCYFPALDEIVYAEDGEGAFWNGRPCRVSRVAEIEESTLCCGSHTSMHKHGREDGFLRLAQQARASRTWGDAYGHMLVATGRVEAMIDPVVMPWDVSAVQIILQEAGGKCTTFDGSPLPRTEAVSSNGILHRQVLEAFAS